MLMTFLSLYIQILYKAVKYCLDLARLSIWGILGVFRAFLRLHLEKCHFTFFSVRNFQHFPSQKSFGFVQKNKTFVER